MITINDTFPILKLPDELICEILSHIPTEDMFLCCLICKKFLDVLLGLSHGVFELNLKNTTSIKHLPKVLDCKQISSIITHLIVTHPHDSAYSSVRKIISSTEKGISYKYLITLYSSNSY
jgi:hypothetical protein